MANPLSSLSYTNKDFNSIYPELLDLVKQLTHKWDPSISNESDPGVILLKLNAIIGDKNNYNIDKNILEAFPETVTQEINARNNYKQLAYNMPWYQSANTKISLKWVGEELAEGVRVVIPKYTMVCDEQSSTIYTLLEEPVFTLDQDVTTAKAQEGVIITHTVNGSDVIGLVHLDSKNRLYLNDYNIAENGVFITNAGDSSLNLWQQVDNLQVKTLGNKYYEFGIDSRNNVCYLEFPEDIDALIGSGLCVKYLISSGEDGNVAARTLDRFYEEISITVGNETLPLNADVVQLYNPSESVGGANPETITDAYNSYRKTAGTFNTLVTIRDYINAIYASGLVSNGFVCDRTTDVQTAYKVVVDDDVNPIYTYQTKDTPDYEEAFNYIKEKSSTTISDSAKSSVQDVMRLYDCYNEESLYKMSAFDLKLYLLHNPGVINNIDKYDSTFTLEDPDSVAEREVLGYISEQKCIQHDFKPLLPDVPCIFENRFPIIIKIVPQMYLTEQQQSEVKLNIIKALYPVVNSRAVEFGEEPDYDVIYDAICNADERIKVAILDDFSYVTFATYWDNENKQFKSIPVSSRNYLSSNKIIEFTSVEDLENYAPAHTSPIKISTTKRNGAYFIYAGSNSLSVPSTVKYIKLEGKNMTLDAGDIFKYNPASEKFELYSKHLTDFQKQVVVKSILAGKTPLYTPETKFNYSITQQHKNEVDAEKITTYSMISPYSVDTTIGQTNIGTEENPFNIPTPKLPDTAGPADAQYTLQDNESIRLLAPSFVTSRSYSNYVKFELVLQGRSLQRKIEITSSSDIEEGTNYYIRPDDKATCYNTGYEAYEELGELITYLENLQEESELTPEQKQQLDNATIARDAWKTSLETFMGYEEGATLPETLTPDAAKSEAGTWVYDPKINFCTGEFTMDRTVVASSIRFSVSDTDPVYYTRFVAKKSVSVFREETVHTLPSNTDYQLKRGEHIAFFWREEDGDDIPYKYIKYEGIDRTQETSTKKSPIIRSNFTIYGTNTPTILGLNDTGEIVYGDDNYSKVAEFYGDNDLSGTKTIDIREMNQVVLDREGTRYKQKNKIYFVTKDKTQENKYRLTLERTDGTGDMSEDGIATYRYTLTSDEYFIYTSNDMTEFEILSAGTLIGIDVFAAKDTRPYDRLILENTAIDYNTLATRGIDSFSSYCNSVPTNYTMFAREQQMYNIVGGDTLYLNIIDREVMCNANTHLFPLSEEQTQEEQALVKQTAVPYFCSWLDTVVAGFTLNYQSAAGSEVALPQLDIENDSDCRWVGRAYLNISSSVDSPQLIIACPPNEYGNDGKTPVNARQSTQCISLGDTVYPHTTGEYESTTLYEDGASICLESDVVLDKVGGTDVDITYITLDGERNPTKLYLYTDNSEEFDTHPYDMLEDGTVHVALDAAIVQEDVEGGLENSKYTKDISLDSNSYYILPIQNTSDNTTFDFFAWNSNVTTPSPLEALNSDYDAKGYSYGTYYFVLYSPKLNILDKIGFQLHLPTGDSPNGKLIIHKMIKCSPNTLFETPLYKKLFPYDNNSLVSQYIINKMREYDYKDLFKYNHIPKEEDVIDDPLDSKSFFNQNHVFNSFTIGHAELRISDATDSKTTIVNNR